MIEKKEVSYAAQLDDIMVLLLELVKTIKEKGNYTSLVDEVINAVSGIDEIDDEFKASLETCVDTVVTRAIQIGFLFSPIK